MKRVKLYVSFGFILPMMIWLFTICGKKADAKALDFSETNNTVGMAINLVKDRDDGFSVNYQNPIFNNEMISDLVVENNCNTTYFGSSKFFCESFKEYSRKISLNAGVDYEYYDTTFKISLESTLGCFSNLHTYIYEKFYSKKETTVTKIQYIKNLDSVNMYDYYSENFISKVYSAYNSKNISEIYEIFNTYGTHFFTACSFGKTKEYYSYFFSNEMSDVNTYVNTINTKIQTVSSESDLNLAMGQTITNLYTNNSYKVKFEDINGLISTKTNKYLPIWEYFDSSIKKVFKDAYTEYQKNCLLEYNFPIIDTYKIPDYRVVTDDGYNKNFKDYILLDSEKCKNYKYITVSIYFQGTQIDKGDSMICIYTGNESEPITKLRELDDSYIDLTKGNKREPVHIDNLGFTLTNITNNCLWLLYDAKGEKSDDWAIENLFIRIEYSNNDDE